MKRSMALLALVLAAAGARAELVDIDNAGLARLLAAGVPVIDIRTAPEWSETGIVPGSHPLTFFDERGRASPRDWLAKARAVAKPGAPVILICRSGSRTRRVGDFLVREAGYGKVYHVRDGILAWARDGRPLTPAAPIVAACRKTQSC